LKNFVLNILSLNYYKAELRIIMASLLRYINAQ